MSSLTTFGSMSWARGAGAGCDPGAVRVVYVDGWSGVPMVEWDALERRQARELAADLDAVMLAASRA